MKVNSGKKGEISTRYLIMIIILIASFAIILFFIFRLNLQETGDKEICHNSVVLKSKGKGLVGDLDCKTNYVCISGGKDCEGINPTTTIKVDPKNKEEIMKAIAEEMADCWWMFGEGELDYLGLGEEGLSKTTCAMCSIIKFDEKILKEDYKITYTEFYEYLNTIKKDESQTYLTYLYDVYNIKELQENFFLDKDIEKNFILTKDRYAIVTGVKKGATIKVFGKDINLPWFKRNLIPSYYIKSESLSEELGCDEYVTKA